MKFISIGITFVLVFFLAVLSGLQVSNKKVPDVNAEVIQKNEVKKKFVQTEPRVFSKAGEQFSAVVEKSVELTVETALTKMQDLISGK